MKIKTPEWIRKSVKVKKKRDGLKKTFIAWDEYGLLLERLLKEIKKDNQEFSGVYGIKRGGLPIAVFMSHQLNLPLLDKPDAYCLLVDDIKENGITSEKLRRKKFACLYASSWVKSKPDYYVKMKKNRNSWIIFPYENFETERSKDNE